MKFPSVWRKRFFLLFLFLTLRRGDGDVSGCSLRRIGWGEGGGRSAPRQVRKKLEITRHNALRLLCLNDEKYPDAVGMNERSAQHQSGER